MTSKSYWNKWDFLEKSPEKIFESHPHWPEVRSLIHKLQQNHFRAYLAGGCVRDGLLGRSPKDFDIATDARPEAVHRLFPNALLVGAAFGVVMVPMQGYQVEITTFRSEGRYLDARHPEEVVFSTPEEDAQRRDFTINALFYDLESAKVLDFVDGIKDLKAGRLRAVGRPQERFQEDALRTLRAIRFSAELGFPLEDKTYLAVKEEGPLLQKISRERVFQEWRQLCQARFVNQGWALCRLSGVYAYMFPEDWRALFESPLLWAKVKWRVSLLENHQDPFQVWVESLALGLGEINEQAQDASLPGQVGWRQLTLPSQNLKGAQKIWKRWRALSGETQVRSGQILEWLADEGGERLLEFWRSEQLWQEASLKPVQEILAQYHRVAGPQGRLPAPLVTGEDLQNWGQSPGPEMGRWIQEIRWQQLEGRLVTVQEAQRLWQSQ